MFATCNNELDRVKYNFTTIQPKFEEIKIWDANTTRLLKVLKSTKYPTDKTVFRLYATSICFSHDSKFMVAIISQGIKNVINVWDIESGEIVKIIKNDQNDMYVICSPVDNNIFATCGSRKDKWAKFRVWSILDKRTLKTIEDKEAKDVVAIQFSPDGKKIITVNNNCQLNTWNIQTKNETKDESK